MGWGREYDGHRVQLDVLPVSADFIDFFGMTMKEGRGSAATPTSRRR